MAPSRRLSNGRSPLVNQQSQITSFFTKTSSSPSPSPSPSPTNLKQNPKSKPNPNPSPSPTTPSPHQAKLKKSLLVIGPSTPTTPDTAKKSLGKEVVNKRMRVYWPLDQSWYEGCVKSFDKLTGKHLIQYDDADEEFLDLAKEKIEWVEEKPKSFRRLRRASVVLDDEDDDDDNVKEEESGGDDSTDEDWGKNAGNEAEAEVTDDGSKDMDLEDEDAVEITKRKRGSSSVSRKRKMSGGKIVSGKKSKNGGEVEKKIEATTNAESK